MKNALKILIVNCALILHLDFRKINDESDKNIIDLENKIGYFYWFKNFIKFSLFSEAEVVGRPRFSREPIAHFISMKESILF